MPADLGYVVKRIYGQRKFNYFKTHSGWNRSKFDKEIYTEPPGSSKYLKKPDPAGGGTR